MDFIDLFSGIGGFRLGMELAGHTPVGWAEKDKFARKSYEVMYNAEEEWSARDIRGVKPEELPEADCYTGGFPCQSFSIAGNRGGFEDTRGTLFFEILRLAKERQPKYLFLENVRGLLNHDGGTTFSTILKSLDELGYSVEWQVLNSKNFGVPQNRERVFIIGHLRKASTRKVFPIRRKNEKDIKKHQIDSSGKNYRSQNDRIYETDGVKCSLPSKQTASKTKIIFNELRGNDFRTKMKGLCPTLVKKMGTGGNNVPMLKVRACLTPERVNKRQNGRRFKNDGEPSFTLNTQDRHGVVLEDSELKIRKLTPKECWRLQGFPDWAFERAKEVNSDTQLYRQAGNSVSVPVIEVIARRLKNDS